MLGGAASIPTSTEAPGIRSFVRASMPGPWPCTGGATVTKSENSTARKPEISNQSRLLGYLQQPQHMPVFAGASWLRGKHSYSDTPGRGTGSLDMGGGPPLNGTSNLHVCCNKIFSLILLVATFGYLA